MKVHRVIGVLLAWALLAPAAAAAEPLTVVGEQQLSPRLDRVHAAHARAGRRHGRARPAAARLRRAPAGALPCPVPAARLLRLRRARLAGVDDARRGRAGDRGPRPHRRHARRRRRGMYTNWFNNGLGGPPRWEDYHVGQLIPWTDARFRTRAQREGRVIAGLSMGGFGAMKYAARQPDLFVAAASFSGAVDTNILGPPSTRSSAQDGGAPGVGLRARARPRRSAGAAQNPWDLAENLRALQLGGARRQRQQGRARRGTSARRTTPSRRRRTSSRSACTSASGARHRHTSGTTTATGTHTWPYWARTCGAASRADARPRRPAGAARARHLHRDRAALRGLRLDGGARAPGARVQPPGGRGRRRVHARRERRPRR